MRDLMLKNMTLKPSVGKIIGKGHFGCVRHGQLMFNKRELADERLDAKTKILHWSLVCSTEDPSLPETIREGLIPRSQLKLGQIIGKGHFGCVHHGQLMFNKRELAD